VVRGLLVRWGVRAECLASLPRAVDLKGTVGGRGGAEGVAREAVGVAQGKGERSEH
jgi:hypothetical protein